MIAFRPVHSSPLRIALAAAALAITGSAAWFTLGTLLAGPDGEGGAVIVVPFASLGAPPEWSATDFATTLADQLTAATAIPARVGSGREDDADYVVEGTVRYETSHATLAVRVRHAHQRTAFWSATFWRTTITDSTLVDDLTAGIAEVVLLPTPPRRADAASDSAIPPRLPQ